MKTGGCSSLLHQLSSTLACCLVVPSRLSLRPAVSDTVTADIMQPHLWQILLRFVTPPPPCFTLKGPLPACHPLTHSVICSSITLSLTHSLRVTAELHKPRHSELP